MCMLVDKLSMLVDVIDTLWCHDTLSKYILTSWSTFYILFDVSTYFQYSNIITNFSYCLLSWKYFPNFLISQFLMPWCNIIMYFPYFLTSRCTFWSVMYLPSILFLCHDVFSFTKQCQVLIYCWDIWLHFHKLWYLVSILAPPYSSVHTREILWWKYIWEWSQSIISLLKWKIWWPKNVVVSAKAASPDSCCCIKIGLIPASLITSYR